MQPPYSGACGKYNELWRQGFKYGGVLRAEMRECITSGARECVSCLLLPRMRANSCIVLHLLCPQPPQFFFGFFLVFFPAPPPSAPLSPLLRAASPLVSWPVNDVVAQRDTFNEGVYVREAHTEGRFVVSRAFSLAPEALAKSAVRFGSLHCNRHTM